MRCDSSPPAAASAGACAARGSCAWGALASQDRRAGAEAPVEVDHPEAAHQPEFRILHLPAFGLARELAQCFDQAERAARGAGLADGELTAGGIERERAVPGEGMAADERRRFAFRAEA